MKYPPCVQAGKKNQKEKRIKKGTGLGKLFIFSYIDIFFHKKYCILFNFWPQK